MYYDGSINIDTKVDVSAFKKGIGSLKSIAGAGAKAIGTAITAVSAGLIAAGGYAFKVGIEFESAFAGVVKTVNATDEELSVLRKSILDMSTEIPLSASAIAEIAEAAGQLGIETANIEGFTRTMADLGTSTNMASTEAATSLAKLANITQMPQTKFDRLGSSIVALGNNFSTTEADITQMALRIAGAGKQVGMTEPEIMGLATALSSVGIEAEMGGSSISKVLINMSAAGASSEKLDKILAKTGLTLRDLELMASNDSSSFTDLADSFEMTRTELSALLKNGTDLENFGKISGMTGAEFKKAFEEDAVGALQLFIGGLGNADQAGSSAIEMIQELGITETRLRDSLLRAAGAGDLLTDAVELSTKAWDENNALSKEAEQRYETLESKLTIAKNSVDVLGIAIKDSMDSQLRGAVDAGIGYIQRLTDAFNKGGLSAAVEEAGNIFAELATEVAKRAPEMVKTAVSFIQSFINGIKNNFPQIKAAAWSLVKTLVTELSNLLPNEIKKPVQDAIKSITKSFENGNLKSAVNTVITVFKNIGKTVTWLVKTILPPLVKIVDMIAGAHKALVPLILGAVAAYKGYAVVKSITAWVAAMSAATTAETLATAASTGAITLKQIAVGVLTGQIGLATAAQYLWNAAMSANPIGVAIGLVAGLTAAIGFLVLSYEDEASVAGQIKKLDEDIANTKEKLIEANNNLSDSYSDVLDGVEAFIDGFKSGKTIIDDFNSNLIISDKVKSEISNQMDSVQGEITEIARNATEERRKLTQSEIDRLDELFKKMNELTKKEIEIEEAYVDAIKTQAEILSESRDTSLEDYQEYANDYAVSAATHTDEIIAKAKEQATEELIIKKGLVGTDKKYTEDWFKEESAIIKANREDKIADAKKNNGKILTELSKGYYNKNKDLKSHLEEMSKLLKESDDNTNYYEKLREDEKDRHNKAIRDIEDKNIGFIAKSAAIASEIQQNELNEKKIKNDELKAEEKNKNDRIKLLQDESVANSLSMWLALVSDTEKYGGELPKEAEILTARFLDAFDDAPEDVNEKWKKIIGEIPNTLKSSEKQIKEVQKEFGKELIDWMFSGSKGKAPDFLGYLKKLSEIDIPAAVNTKKSKDETLLLGRNIVGGVLAGAKEEKPKLMAFFGRLAGEIVQSQENDWKVNSPSRVMRDLYRFVMAGAEVAVEEKTPSLVKKFDKAGKQALDTMTNRLKNSLKTDGLIADLQASVLSDKALAGNSLTASVIHKVTAENERADSEKVISAHGNIQTTIEIDGREFAIATKPYVSEELAFGGA